MGKNFFILILLFLLSFCFIIKCNVLASKVVIYHVTAEQKKEQFIDAYNEYSDEIFRYCFFRVYDREKAREMAQETFMRAWKYLVDGKEIEQPRAFLYKTAYHLIVDNSKKKSADSLEKMMKAGFDLVDKKQCNKQDYLDVMAVKQEIEGLDEKYRELIQLRLIEDLPIKDIAFIVGESENYVAVNLHRGLKKLKVNFVQYEYSGENTKN